MSWKDYEIAAERGPGAILWKIFLAIVCIGIVVGIAGYIFSWFGETGKVIKDEFGPNALLEKYEWFKDVSATLDKKLIDIQVYEKRIKGMKEEYVGLPRNKWPREDREQVNVWQSEVAGVVASYNSLAAEYNAQMAKFNWRFANAGMLPEGAKEPVRREYKDYVLQ